MGESASFRERLVASHPAIAWRRYSDAQGNLLAAGVAYYGFFSVFPALALAAAVFGFVLQGRPDLVETIAAYLNDLLPGVVRSAANPDGFIEVTAPQTTTLTLTGLVSLVVLLFSGIGWVGAMRTGIRMVFGSERMTNVVKAKARDVLALFTLGVGIAVSAVGTSLLFGLAGHVAVWAGLPEDGLLVTLFGLVVGAAFDTLLMVILLRLLSGVALPWSNVRNGAVLGAVGLTLLKLFAGTLVGRATANPLLGAVAVAVGLLFWLNLVSRVVLFSAAWAAADTDVARSSGLVPEPEVSEPTVPTPEPYAAEPAPRPTPSRAIDLVSLASGALLGAVGTALTMGVHRARRPRP